ncbi:hypothetical protein ACOMHN_004347 [Nucella lapillus]
MVHTRHSGDVEVNSPPTFLSLEDRKSRKTRSACADFEGHESDENGGVFQRKKRSVFDEKIVDTRLRPRTGPSRSYNYVFGDSSDDEMTSRRRSRMLSEEEYGVPRRKTQYRRIQSQSSDEEDQKERNHWRGTRSKPQTKEPSNPPEEDDDDDDDDEEEDGHPRGELDEDHDDEDLNNSAVRRSSRLKRKPHRFFGSLRKEEKDGAVGKFDKGKRSRSGENDNSGEEFEDMYSRVKRARTKKMDDDQQENSASNSDGTHDEKNDSGDETQQRRSYSLREHKPRTQRYIAPAIEGKKRTKQAIFHQDSPPPRRRVAKQAAYCSPAHRRPNIRKRQAFHGSSSSTSSDSSDSGTETSDEQRFSRRKAKSMAKARARICPLNFTADMASSNRMLKDRVRSGASLADVDPMEIDKSVTFDSVGGLHEHIMKLKEMVVFPLLYPEFYEKFKVAPSRGVLFYGPPGTGKTLVARALANECSRGAQKVAFFMRKGADCLSKWVGEAERQLRLLFDKAYEMRPSIIFFDEIDGLAPVRSSRQDQIHSSIVSTLLALMDGIDSRGEIVVIGATNRIDSIDPALRRPGRFDKEFHFPLPSLKDRKKILKIHTKEWIPSLRDDFLCELAEKCCGYCGADLKCLVTEATQNALRRRYPQIYTTSDKLQLDVASITLTASDFAMAITNIVPAAQRAAPNPVMALEASVRPLLTRALIRLERALGARFPFSKLTAGTGATRALQDGSSESPDMSGLIGDLPADEEENAPSIFMPTARGHRPHAQQAASAVSFLRSTSSLPLVFRPRILVSGESGEGQSVHLAPAALHLMEHLPVHTLNSATLFAASAKMPEEACAHVFHEAKRTAPSVIFIPYINELWGVVTDCLRVTFLTMVRSMNPSCPILILATCETTYTHLDEQLKELFSVSGGEVVEVDSPTREERHNFFHDLIMLHTMQAPPTHRQAARRALEALPKAPPPEPRRLTDKEQRQLKDSEEDTLRELRIFLRDILGKMGREKKFTIFTKPVDVEEVPDYYTIIKNPMDLSTMMSKIDLHRYYTAGAFMADIFLICSNALLYNPDRGPTDRGIRHRACALRDMAQALLKAELDPDFERLCQEIEQSRKTRGVDSSQSVPAYYHTQPVEKMPTAAGSAEVSKNAAAVCSQSSVPEGCRYSRRVRGLDADRTQPGKDAERMAQLEKSPLGKEEHGESAEKEHSSFTALSSVHQSGDAEKAEESSKKSPHPGSTLDSSSVSDKDVESAGAVQGDCACPSSLGKGPSPVHSGKTTKGSSDSKPSSAHRRASQRKRCPWLAPRRRRRHHSTPVHRHNLTNSVSDVELVELVTDEESMDAAETSPTTKQPEGWNSLPQSQEKHSLEPASVHVPSMVGKTRSGSDIIPTASQEQECGSKEQECGSKEQECGGKEQETARGAAGERREEGGGEGKPPRSVVRSLDMDLMVAHVDSGISSESNGDSRDSLDHNNSNRNPTTVESHVEDGSVASTSTSGSSTRTRSRAQNLLQLSALAVLEGEVGGQVVGDRDRLKGLLERVVQLTDAFTVERLQRLYSVLNCAIFTHRYNLHKEPLIQEMEAAVHKACQEWGSL